jgi:hypothetical protein
MNEGRIKTQHVFIITDKKGQHAKVQPRTPAILFDEYVPAPLVGAWMHMELEDGSRDQFVVLLVVTQYRESKDGVTLIFGIGLKKPKFSRWRAFGEVLPDLLKQIGVLVSKLG